MTNARYNLGLTLYELLCFIGVPEWLACLFLKDYEPGDYVREVGPVESIVCCGPNQFNRSYGDNNNNKQKERR
ncbi:MAG: hypothetical protein Fur0011_3050 [Candidatus Microgenomates bacterium]